MGTRGKGDCEHCGAQFNWELHNLSWEPAWGAYCAECGTVVISGGPLPDAWRPRCPCGGLFSRAAVPRCPACRKELSARHAATYIGNGIPPGSVSGCDWPNSWPPGPKFVINGRRVFEV